MNQPVRELRVGVIGAGAFAAACHLPGLAAHPRARVVALCGRRPGPTRELAARFGIAAVETDYRRLLDRDDLDAITVCTPNAAHREPALAALAAGKHLFCEKPLGLSVAEAAAMHAAAIASARIHQVSFVYRYLYGVEELRRRVAAGDVGEPFLLRLHHETWDGLAPSAPIGWRERRGPAGGGVLYDLGSHFFDLARHLLGEVTSVAAFLHHLPRTRPLLPTGELAAVETDDLAAAWFRFANGAAGQWFASRITPPRGENVVQVVGRDGALEALLSRGRLDALRIARPGQGGWHELPLPAAAADGESHALTRMMGGFVEACLAGRLDPRDASFADGLAAQKLIAAAETAAAPAALDLAGPSALQ